MSKVYAVRRASNPYYRELELDVMDVVRYSPDEVSLDEITDFSEHNTSMASWWQPITTNFYDDADDQDKDVPDISPWVGATLVLSPKAYRLLKDTLEKDGEFLPLKINSEKYFLFNCLSLGQDDKQLSEIEYDGDIPLWVNKLVTAPTNEKHAVFKSKLEKGQTLFATERFKNAVKEFRLKGVLFDENLIEKTD